MDDFLEYLSQRIRSVRDDITRLEESGCQDEADFAKVRMNIYDVCHTVTNVLIGRPGAGRKAVETQLERFRGSWSAALENARKHGDARNVVVEETKLEALEDVIAHFAESWK